MNESILIVDDEKEIADLIEVYLKNDGYTVHKFYNGLDALECIETQKMDLAILDTVFNSSVSYFKREEKIYQIASVCRTEKDKMTGRQTEKELYVNQCEIAYKLPDDIKIEERGV